jgi:hypothetical protein
LVSPPKPPMSAPHIGIWTESAGFVRGQDDPDVKELMLEDSRDIFSYTVPFTLVITQPA